MNYKLIFFILLVVSIFVPLVSADYTYDKPPGFQDTLEDKILFVIFIVAIIAFIYLTDLIPKIISLLIDVAALNPLYLLIFISMLIFAWVCVSFPPW